jgi:dTDP-4-amino-4,6-dideoxygalactose transaminase
MCARFEMPWIATPQPTEAATIEELEAVFARLLRVQYVLAVSSGTAALEIALRACRVGFGSEVILSAYDWGAAAGAVLRIGAIPVLADIDPLFYTLDPSSIRGRLRERTRAIVATHLFGHPADIDAIGAFARPRGVRVIEDAAQALGASLRGRPVGTMGDVGCFSLGRGKIVSAGEGGLLVTNDRSIYESAVAWSQHPVAQMKRLAKMGPLSDLAPNFRISPMAAARALVELNQLESRLEERRTNCERLGQALVKTPGIRPPATREGAEHTWHRYSPTFVPKEIRGITRERFIDILNGEGVPLFADFIRRPLHLDPVFQKRGYGAPGWPWKQTGSRRRYRMGDCPVAEARCFELGLGLGSEWSGLPEGYLEQIVGCLERAKKRLVCA